VALAAAVRIRATGLRRVGLNCRYASMGWESRGRESSRRVLLGTGSAFMWGPCPFHRWYPPKTSRPHHRSKPDGADAIDGSVHDSAASSATSGCGILILGGRLRRSLDCL